MCFEPPDKIPVLCGCLGSETQTVLVVTGDHKGNGQQGMKPPSPD